MTEKACYENYPIWMVVVSNLLSLTVYALGSLIIVRLGWIALTGYLGFCLYVETRLMRKSCVHCYYYGKVCAFGRGWLCARLFPEGAPQTYRDTKITWAKMIPDFMVVLFPLGLGMVLVTLDFDWTLLVLLLVLLVVGLGGNATVRSRLACFYCKQNELGCPAVDLIGSSKHTDI